MKCGCPCCCPCIIAGANCFRCRCKAKLSHHDFGHALQVYDEPLATFANDMEPGPVVTVPVMQHGRQALEDISQVSSAG